jgi:VWFA-related protein
VFLAADELMSKQKGRKALVVLTDGEDRGSKERLTDAIEKAQRADTIVYAIYFKGEQPRQESGGDRGGGGRRGGIGFPGGGGGYPGGGGGGGGRRGGGPGGQPQAQVDGKKVLERITQETGGRMFEMTKKQTFAQIFGEIGQELRSQYRLGYTPDADAAADGYHKIDLAFTSKDKNKFTIQTRDGYYTGK